MNGRLFGLQHLHSGFTSLVSVWAQPWSAWVVVVVDVRRLIWIHLHLSTPSLPVVSGVLPPPMACPRRDTSLIWKPHAYVFTCLPAPCPRAKPIHCFLFFLLFASVKANYISALLVQSYSQDWFAFHISFPPFNVTPVIGSLVWFERLCIPSEIQPKKMKCYYP